MLVRDRYCDVLCLFELSALGMYEKIERGLAENNVLASISSSRKKYVGDANVV